LKNSPTLQPTGDDADEHITAPLYDADAHAAHDDDPCELANVPDPHSEHELDATPADQVPAGHTEHTDAPPTEYSPGPHA